MSDDQNFPSYTSELLLKGKKTENKVNIIFITPSNVQCSNILNTAKMLLIMTVSCFSVDEMLKFENMCILELMKYSKLQARFSQWPFDL